MQKNHWITVISVLVIILLAWYLLDFRSGYPKSAEEILNASSTPIANLASTTVNTYSTNEPTSSTKPTASVSPSPVTKTSTNNQNFMHTVTIETNKGTIVFETYDTDAPNTVNNFITLAQKGFYNNTIFHRVIPGFMIQGGDPTGTGMGGPGYKFADELNAETPSYKAGYVRGTVAMANSGPNTNGSQFFIMQKDTPLPHNYTIFGRVVSGLDVVDAISATPTDSGDKPVSNIVMNKVTVSSK